MRYQTIQPCYQIINKDTKLSHLLTEKAFTIFKQSADFKTRYEVVEGRYVYGKNGNIIRVDNPNVENSPSSTPPPLLNEETNNNVDSKRGRRPKSDSSLHHELNSVNDTNTAILTLVNNEG